MHIETAKALISGANIKTLCESCGQDGKWIVPHAKETPDTAALVQMIIAGTDTGMTFIPLICTNCANTRLYQMDYAGA